MKQLVTFFLFAFISMSVVNAQLPFKYDSLYKTIYANQLCKLAEKNPDLLLIDVRSPGEYSDTSQYNSLNMGHLKGAININIDSIRKDIATITPYKNKTIVFYCSHSQRSRRVSKLLSENGFTNYYNLNGGMSVLNQLTEKDFPCKDEWIESALPYKNLSFDDAAQLIKTEKKLVILDVRPAAQYNSSDTDITNNVGRVKGAINIPYSELKQRINEIEKYKGQPLLVYTASGDGDAARAANVLTHAGFATVYHLLGGINDLISSQENISFIENGTPYTTVDAERALALLEKNTAPVIYDTRADDEYYNKLTGMPAYKNLGHMKNAIHVTENNFQSQQLPDNKNVSILIYGHAESFKFAGMLTSKGYKHVYVMDSFYDFVWSGFNVEACKDDRKFLVDHEGLY